MNPQPKPVRAPKKAPRRLRRKARLEAKHWGVSRGPSKGFPKAERGGAAPRVLGRANDPREGKRRGARRGKSTRPKTRASASPANTAPKFPKPEPKHGTKHRNRERGLGRMAFIRSLPCGVPDAFSVIGGSPVGAPQPGPCDGGVQCMHLGWKADPGGRRKPGDTDTAPGCELHHAESGTKLGGLGKWYVALGRDGQRALRAELVARATAAWNALSEAERARWEDTAAARRKG